MQKAEMIRKLEWALAGVLAVLAVMPVSVAAQTKAEPVAHRRVTVGGGIELHYVERGTGVPVVFVHGSLSDAGYWDDQLGPFAEKGYRVIAYSRRYNSPNRNPARPGYSAVVDADDLAALIIKLHLGKVNVVGHSYGALTALFLAVKHPELVRTLVLAEAPAVSLLAHLPGGRAQIGQATFSDIQERMVKPMQAAFRRGDREAGIRTFLAFVLNDPQAWDKMPAAAKQDTLRNAHEWDVMLTNGVLFPDLDPKTVRNITMPVLILSGEKSYPFLGLVDEELDRLLPHSRRTVLPGATHRMWYERPAVCRDAVLNFWKETAAGSAGKEQRNSSPQASPLASLKKARPKPCLPSIQLAYEPLTTSRLFCTLNTPNTWFARMPAICLSMALATVP
jgi:pimeloyl-ACP methyl ester carboxylesterase